MTGTNWFPLLTASVAFYAFVGFEIAHQSLTMGSAVAARTATIGVTIASIQLLLISAWYFYERLPARYKRQIQTVRTKVVR